MEYNDLPDQDQKEVKRSTQLAVEKARIEWAFDRLKDIMHLDRVMGDRWTGEVEVEDIRVKHANSHQDPYMVIVKGTDSDGTPVIAFHSGGSPTDALAGAARRLKTGNMKWKPDEWRIQGG